MPLSLKSSARSSPSSAPLLEAAPLPLTFLLHLPAPRPFVAVRRRLTRRSPLGSLLRAGVDLFLCRRLADAARFPPLLLLPWDLPPLLPAYLRQSLLVPLSWM